MRIAVLDDDRSQTDLVCQVLTAAGHICHPFTSGKEMLAQLRRELYDMLVIDWQVPDLSGAEVLRWAREKLPPTLPVLFMTSRSGEDDIVAGLVILVVVAVGAALPSLKNFDRDIPDATPDDLIGVQERLRSTEPEPEPAGAELLGVR